MLYSVKLSVDNFQWLIEAVYMNKPELIDAIAAHSNTNKTQIATMLDGLTDVVQATLADGNPVQLVGFGTFLK